MRTLTPEEREAFAALLRADFDSAARRRLCSRALEDLADQAEAIKRLRERLVLVESPYAGDIERHLRYGRACMRDCFLRGDLPFASHLLYTQDGVLRDDVPAERALGIEAGLSWGWFAARTVVYADLGISRGMHLGMRRAQQEGRVIEMRSLGAPWT